MRNNIFSFQREFHPDSNSSLFFEEWKKFFVDLCEFGRYFVFSSFCEGESGYMLPFIATVDHDTLDLIIKILDHILSISLPDTNDRS